MNYKKFSIKTLIIVFTILLVCFVYSEEEIKDPSLQPKPTTTQQGIYTPPSTKDVNPVNIGDTVTISVEGYKDFDLVDTIAKDGTIDYKSFGKISVAGLTPASIEEKIKKILEPYVANPIVRVSISREQSERVVSPGDVIEVTVQGNEAYNQKAVVDKDGNISYLNFGQIKVAGQTPSKLEETIGNLLKSYIHEPKVKVKIAEQTIKPGDILQVIVENNESYNRKLKVDTNGNITYLDFEPIKAEGLTPSELSESIKTKLSTLIREPKVNVVIEKAGEMELEEVKEEKRKVEEKEVRLISPGDIIEVVVRDHGDYNFRAIVHPNGMMIYPPFGEVNVHGMPEENLEQKLSSMLARYISNPLVKVLIKGKLKYDKTLLLPHEHILQPGDILQIKLSNRPDYNEISIVQNNGMLYHSKLGWIDASWKDVKTLIKEIGSRTAVKIKDTDISLFLHDFESLTETKAIPDLPRRFGYDDFFKMARERILNLESKVGSKNVGTESIQPKVKDALSGFVGPIDMIDSNVNMTVPPRYTLGPGDRITVSYWSDVVELQTETVVVDEKGQAVIPRSGRIIVVRGMTLDQFQEAVRDEIARVAFKNPKVMVTLDRLRSIQIFITGEAFRPGSYVVSAATTLFNALYLCGGPSENGSMRNIKLLRNNETMTIDFYKYLMNGDSSQDYPLLPGDTILIPTINRIVTINGEVRRPAIYELAEGENLKDLILLAGGIRPSGLLQRIRIDSVIPGTERIVLDVNATDLEQLKYELYDGDIVTVFSIPSERMNTVTIEGKVKMPGIYQLKEGMRISDLISSAQGLLEEAYMERADLIRFNSDKKTTTLIPINLSKVLSKDAESDLPLNQWDKIIVYSKWDTKWVASRIVSVYGAVSRPGSYERHDNMKVSDLLMRAGGTLPEAYLNRAYLMRVGELGEITQSVVVDLGKAISGDTQNNMELKDGDVLMVYTYREAEWQPKREVKITGAVQNPNTFVRTDGMKVSDLIRIAGGLLPTAYPYRALLLRLDERQKVTQGLFINLRLALDNDPVNDIQLKDGDELKVYTYEESLWEPKREVTVTGAVQRPGKITRFDGMRVSDAIKLAGGLMPNAYLERADIRRFRPDYETFLTIPVNITKALSGEEDILLEDGDMLSVQTIREAMYVPENKVTIYGAVQRPDTYIRTYNMKLSDLIFAAGGLTPGAYNIAEVSRIDSSGKVVIITANLEALREGDESQDIMLNDGDIVSIRKEKDFADEIPVVTINGEVKYPGSYTLKRGERLTDLIKRAGGLTDRAYIEAATMIRRVNKLVLDEQTKSIEYVKAFWEETNKTEFQREYAKAMMKSQVAGTTTKPASTSETVIGIPSATGMGNLLVSSSVKESLGIGAISTIPQQTEAALSELERLTSPYMFIVTPARRLDTFMPSGLVSINLKEAMLHPGSQDDILLESNDIITVPPKLETISVTGAVFRPTSVVYKEGAKLKYYIDIAGGYTRDADIEAAYVIKPNGIAIKGKKARLSPGDIIVVPTKVMVSEVTDRWEQLIGLARFSLTILALMYGINIITKRI